jgi:hypothetical protein|mmetsp:Transcript_12318/g.18493  ORF Transcript_12318/g.18493 Transcript_12318/m.18493 type:complete len:253 (-) Transcript_12318:96-854(-)|eukprot:scaffold5100_cov110-Skeletonema_marinoi.AAC.6
MVCRSILSVAAALASFRVAHAYNLQMMASSGSNTSNSSRRRFVSQSVAFGLGTVTASTLSTSLTPNVNNGVANAVGPVKIDVVNPTYTAAPCPKDKPIPGEKAMKGMRGLCVQVKAELAENSPKPLDKVGVYGYVNDALTSESVLANNPDSGTDAGQFAMIQEIKTTDKSIEFEFIAAVPMEKDVSGYEDGIGPLSFKSLRIISFPGGQQFGAISPCEMNEFSEECEAWEAENGEYTKAEFMIKSNPRTKGR